MTNDQCNRLINLLSSIDIKLDKILKKMKKEKVKEEKEEVPTTNFIIRNPSRSEN